jgi:hypothetical protein
MAEAAGGLWASLAGLTGSVGLGGGGGGGGGSPFPFKMGPAPPAPGGWNWSSTGFNGPGGPFPMQSTSAGGDPWSLEVTQLKILAELTTLGKTTTRASKAPAKDQFSWEKQAGEFSRAGTSLIGGGLGMAAGMTGLAGLIDPNAVTTLTGSFKLLGQEVGRIFVPYVYMAADAIQDLTGWFSSFSDTTKTAIGRVAVWGTGFLLLTGVIYKVGSAIITVGSMIKNFFSLTGVLGSPLLIGIAALTALVGGLTYAWMKSGEASKTAADKMREAVSGMGKQVTAEQIKEVFSGEEAAKILGAKTHEERDKIMTGMREDIEKRTAMLQKEAIPEIAQRGKEREALEDEIQIRQKEIRGKLSGPRMGEEEETLKRGILRQMQKSLAETKLPGPIEQMIEKNKIKIQAIDKLFETMGITPGHTRDLAPPIKSRYTSALEYRESVQLAALNIPDTETQALLNQMVKFNENLGQGGPLILELQNQTRALVDALKRISPVQGPGG